MARAALAFSRESLLRTELLVSLCLCSATLLGEELQSEDGVSQLMGWKASFLSNLSVRDLFMAVPKLLERALVWCLLQVAKHSSPVAIPFPGCGSRCGAALRAVSLQSGIADQQEHQSPLHLNALCLPSLAGMFAEV